MLEIKKKKRRKKRPTTRAERKRKREVELPRKFSPLWLEDQDKRTIPIRRIMERFEVLAADIGIESAQRELLVKRIAFYEVLISTLEVELLSGKSTTTVGQHIMATNALVGLLRTVGIERTKIIGTDLKTYVAANKPQFKKRKVQPVE